MCLRSLQMFLFNSAILHLVTASKLPHSDSLSEPPLPVESLASDVAFLLSSALLLPQTFSSNVVTLECLRRSLSLLMTTLSSLHSQSEASHRSPSRDSFPTPLKPGIPTLPKGAPVVFRKGDAVDGLCEVSNGTKRWFPGEVAEVHADGCVDIKVALSRI